ncbi:MAG: hypothetical protein HRU31_16435, partial [Rhodobacteraceae bacterium]|nr:hypothetical protein [Paracoccaceae bacterium]
MEGDTFQAQALEAGVLVPSFVIDNQQGNRWIQQVKVVLRPDGVANYIERATTTFQAPYFNFKRYPFDTQSRTLDVQSLYPTNVVNLLPWDETSGLSDLLGEEAWILNTARLVTTETKGLS